MTVQDTRTSGDRVPTQRPVVGQRSAPAAPAAPAGWDWVSLLPDSAVVVGRDGRVVAANSGACQCFERALLLGLRVEELLPGWEPRTGGGVPAATTPYAFEARRSGELVRVQVSESALGPDHDGATLLVLRPAPPATGNALFRTLVEVDPDAKILVAEDGTISLVNARAEEMFGYSREELLGLPVRSLLPADMTVAPGETGCVREVTACRRDGTRFPSEVALAEVVTQESRAVVAAVRDVSDKWFAQHRFQQLVEHAPDAKLIIDVEGRIVLVNAQAEHVFGYARTEVVGQQVGLLLPGCLEDYLQELRAGTDVDRGPGRHTVIGSDVDVVGRRLGGSEFPVEVSLSVLQTEDGVLVSAAVRDLSERRMAERRFRDLLEAAPDGKVIADEHGVIVLVNHRTEQMFGWSREELVGQPVEMLLPATLRAAYEEHKAGFRRQTGPLQLGVGSALHALRRDGTEFPIEVTLAPLQTEDGVLVSAAIRDVSERLALVAESERLKSEFFATLSHELRTPLTSIIGYGEMLEDMDEDGLSPIGRRFLQVIARSAARELRLVDDLLTLVAIEASSFDVHPTRTSLLEVLRHVVAEAAPGAQEAGQQVRLRSLDDHEATDEALEALEADVDEQRLTQALTHLTQNVVKHCPAGTTLELGVRSTGNGVVVEVVDDGPGIAQQELPHVFERLFRGAEAVRHERQGAGLGLPIAKAIVESHGGTLTGESVPGEGTTFRVVLPRQRPGGHDRLGG